MEDLMRAFKCFKLSCIAAAAVGILVFLTMNFTIDAAIGIMNDTYHAKVAQSGQPATFPSEFRQLRGKINALAGPNRGINCLILFLAACVTGYLLAVFLEKKQSMKKAYNDARNGDDKPE